MLTINPEIFHTSVSRLEMAATSMDDVGLELASVKTFYLDAAQGEFSDRQLAQFSILSVQVDAYRKGLLDLLDIYHAAESDVDGIKKAYQELCHAVLHASSPNQDVIEFDSGWNVSAYAGTAHHAANEALRSIGRTGSHVHGFTGSDKVLQCLMRSSGTVGTQLRYIEEVRDAYRVCRAAVEDFEGTYAARFSGGFVDQAYAKGAVERLAKSSGAVSDLIDRTGQMLNMLGLGASIGEGYGTVLYSLGELIVLNEGTVAQAWEIVKKLEAQGVTLLTILSDARLSKKYASELEELKDVLVHLSLSNDRAHGSLERAGIAVDNAATLHLSEKAASMGKEMMERGDVISKTMAWAGYAVTAVSALGTYISSGGTHSEKVADVITSLAPVGAGALTGAIVGGATAGPLGAVAAFGSSFLVEQAGSALLETDEGRAAARSAKRLYLESLGYGRVGNLSQYFDDAAKRESFKR